MQMRQGVLVPVDEVQTSAQADAPETVEPTGDEVAAEPDMDVTAAIAAARFTSLLKDRRGVRR